MSAAQWGGEQLRDTEHGKGPDTQCLFVSWVLLANLALRPPSPRVYLPSLWE